MLNGLVHQRLPGFVSREWISQLSLSTVIFFSCERCYRILLPKIVKNNLMLSFIYILVVFFFLPVYVHNSKIVRVTPVRKKAIFYGDGAIIHRLT